MTVALTHKLFVYGSLMSKLGNHHILSGLSPHVRLLSDQCVSVEKFYLSGLKSNEYPYLSEVPLHPDQISSCIKGELYEVSTDALSKLDEFEEHPVEYLRSMIDVIDISAGVQKNQGIKYEIIESNVYLLKNEERIDHARAAFDAKFIVVNNGDWREHLDGIES
jgi:gamma-glutamylcyclotransferase (GGCT)/AIG2-like uncharacterized protein YtfP